MIITHIAVIDIILWLSLFFCIFMTGLSVRDAFEFNRKRMRTRKEIEVVIKGLQKSMKQCRNVHEWENYAFGKWILEWVIA